MWVEFCFDQFRSGLNDELLRAFGGRPDFCSNTTSRHVHDLIIESVVTDNRFQQDLALIFECELQLDWKPGIAKPVTTISLL